MPLAIIWLFAPSTNRRPWEKKGRALIGPKTKTVYGTSQSILMNNMDHHHQIHTHCGPSFCASYFLVNIPR